MKSSRGFTLIELMIAVVIVAILAAVALPAYDVYIRQAKMQEATALLAANRVRMEQYFQDNRTYVGASLSTTGAKHFNYAFTNGPSATDYTITATGSVAAGMAGYSYTIDQANNKTSVADGTIGATCWLTKKSGSC